ncbi:unnamed protein product [Brachionus calyciflorus]|uniref:Uncharacterized protein n=1 Tax=Brachionus calyciflorus TaxID=104777 RepID=A0A814J348_9BILA|nr:unnamed protein product [Brachionus calyciflorus]
MSNRKWGINNDRVKGSYIDHFECLVCERLHEDLNRLNKGQVRVTRKANKNHYGCPEPYTFSEDGVLLNEKNNSNYLTSSFMTSYELGYIQQKLFFEKYYSKNLFNFSHKSFEWESLRFHRDHFMKNREKFDLK